MVADHNRHGRGQLEVEVVDNGKREQGHDQVVKVLDQELHCRVVEAHLYLLLEPVDVEEKWLGLVCL